MLPTIDALRCNESLIVSMGVGYTSRRFKAVRIEIWALEVD